ncbi:hypothetical protein ACFL2V_09585 [Pseudomonadota bacterium]
MPAPGLSGGSSQSPDRKDNGDALDKNKEAKKGKNSPNEKKVADEIKEQTTKELEEAKGEVEQKKKRKRRRRPRRKKKPELAPDSQEQKVEEPAIEPEPRAERQEEFTLPEADERPLETPEEEPTPDFAPIEELEEPREEVMVGETDDRETQEKEEELAGIDEPVEEIKPEEEEEEKSAAIEEVSELEEPLEPVEVPEEELEQKEENPIVEPDNDVDFAKDEEDMKPIPLGKLKEEDETSQDQHKSPFEYKTEPEDKDNTIIAPMYIGGESEKSPEDKESEIIEQKSEIEEEKEDIKEEEGEAKTKMEKTAAHDKEDETAKAIEEIKEGLDTGLEEDDNGTMIKGIFKTVIQFVVIIIVLAGMTWSFFFFGINEWILGGGDTKTEVSEVEGEALSDEEMRKFGLLTALQFGEGSGSSSDVAPVQIQIADYFGRLKEPKITGETGISAATYYGGLEDLKEVTNKFIDYVETLEHMQNLYVIDVYELLSRTPERQAALNAYTANLIDAKEKGKRVIESLKLNIDDLTESFQSISPDKDQYEADFFVALEEMQPEKSDSLLKVFVDISQKQTALKARVRALEKLLEYYDVAIEKLDKRITAIQQNTEALVQGIRVVDVPGGGIDIIIREE